MANLRIAHQHLAFGRVAIVDSADEAYIATEFVAGEASADASAPGESQRDDTAAFVAEQTRDEVYLKLPVPAFLVRAWAWFDEKFGVQYR